MVEDDHESIGDASEWQLMLGQVYRRRRGVAEEVDEMIMAKTKSKYLRGLAGSEPFRRR